MEPKDTFTFDMPERTERVTELIKVQELNVTLMNPKYKLKLTKKRRIRVKIENRTFSVHCKLTVKLKAGIRINEIWQSGGVKYIVVSVDNFAQDALLISTGEPVDSFNLPKTFLYIGSAYVGESSKQPMKELLKDKIKQCMDIYIFDKMVKTFNGKLDADRGIYETWGGRSITAYNTVKEIYKILLDDNL